MRNLDPGSNRRSRPKKRRTRKIEKLGCWFLFFQKYIFFSKRPKPLSGPFQPKRPKEKIFPLFHSSKANQGRKCCDHFSIWTKAEEPRTRNIINGNASLKIILLRRFAAGKCGAIYFYLYRTDALDIRERLWQLLTALKQKEEVLGSTLGFRRLGSKFA